VQKYFKYRIYPTKQQERLLEATLEECRWLYNYLLEQRKTAWEQRGETLKLYDQVNTLPAVKAQRPALKAIHSQVLQNVTVRIERAFQGFFRRVQAGQKPGYPRFRGAGRYDSFTYPQAPSGCKLVAGTHPTGKAWLHLTHVGSVRVVLHRPLEGTPKTVTVRRSATGKWYVSICCEWEPTPLPTVEPQVGIDVGLTTFATFSTGEKIANPRFFRKAEKALAKAQRQLSKTDKRAKPYRKRKRVVARVHERTAWRRQDFAHQQSRRIVNGYQVIAVEELSVHRLIHHPCLAKSIHDAAWAEFADCLAYKAAYAGRQFARVDPAYTSQDCSGCGHRQRKPLSERTHRCCCCGLVLDRDQNAALNILRLGLQSLGSQPVEAHVL
jgi:putative transposase